MSNLHVHVKCHSVDIGRNGGLKNTCNYMYPKDVSVTFIVKKQQTGRLSRHQKNNKKPYSRFLKLAKKYIDMIR